MAINWNPIEVQKPEFKSAKDIFKGMQDVREMRRKRAIEDAIKAGVGPDGQFSGGRVRQSLTDAGFGEDADAVVRDIAMKRQGDVKSTAELGVMLKGLVNNGIINESRARELFDNMTFQEPIGTSTTSTVSTTSTPATGTGQIDETQLMQQAQSFVDEAPKSQPSGSPGSGTRQSVVGATEAIIRPEGDLQPTGGVASLTDIGPQTRTRRTEAQATPDYASDLINWEKRETTGYDVGMLSTDTFDYKLPTDERDLSETLAAAQRLGYDISDSTSESIDRQITDRAFKAAGPPPVLTPGYTLADITKNNAEYIQRQREWMAKAAELKQAQVDALSKERAGKFGEVQSKEAQDFALGGQKGADGKPLATFWRHVSPVEAAEVKKQRAAVDDIITANVGTFSGQYKAALAKAKADGSVNQDAIMANLVAMGAVPSSDALYLKQFMTPGGNFTSEGMGFLKQFIAAVGESGRKKISENAAAWKRDAISNINQYIIDNGGKPYGGSGRESAADSLSGMGVGPQKPPSGTQPPPKKPSKPQKPAKRTSEGM